MSSLLDINDIVGQDDILFHLGDWSFGGFESITEFRNRINCKNIHLILGNHDHHIERNKGDIRNIFTSVNQYLELNVNNEYNFVLMHYPLISWNRMNEGVIHLHGHVHLPKHQRISEGRAMDVGVDGNNLYPINIKEIRSIMKDRPNKKASNYINWRS